MINYFYKSLAVYLSIVFLFCPVMVHAQDGLASKVTIKGKSPSNPVSTTTITVEGVSVDGVTTYIAKDGESHRVIKATSSTMEVEHSPDGLSPNANQGDVLTRDGNSVRARFGKTRKLPALPGNG